MKSTRLLPALGLLFGLAQADAQSESVPVGTSDSAGLIKAALAEVAAADPGNAEAGSAKAAVCGACHGADGNSIDPQYPKLAGQHEAYLANQLALFKAQIRQNPLMFGMTMTLSPEDMRDLGAWFATQTANAGLADETPINDPYSPHRDRRLVDLGQDIFRAGVAERGVPACMSCHGPDGRGNPAAGFPALAGQHSSYTAQALNRYRAVAPGDPILEVANAATMVAIASRLRADEASAVASYIEGLHAVGEVSAPLASAGH